MLSTTKELLRVGKKLTNTLSSTVYNAFLEAKYSEDRDIMVLKLSAYEDKLFVEEQRKDFTLRYKTDFSVNDDCIESLRQDVGYRCLMYRKRLPKVVILVPTKEALRLLGLKLSFKLLFGDSWKGSSLDPMERLIAEYKVFM